jgi:hypothetical protein
MILHRAGTRFPVTSAGVAQTAVFEKSVMVNYAPHLWKS